MQMSAFQLGCNYLPVKQLMQFYTDPIITECCLLNQANVEKVHCVVVWGSWEKAKDKCEHTVLAQRDRRELLHYIMSLLLCYLFVYLIIIINN